MFDEYSHLVWVENMKSGQELCPVVEELLYLAETEEINGDRSQIRWIRGDCVSFSNDLAEMVNQRRIRLENTTPHAHKKRAGETVIGLISRLTRSIMAGCRINMSSDSGSRACAHLLLPL